MSDQGRPPNGHNNGNYQMHQVPRHGWTLRKEVNISAVIAFVIAIGGGIAAFTTLRADVEHKASKTDVRVLENRVDNVETNVQEIKEGIKELLERTR